MKKFHLLILLAITAISSNETILAKKPIRIPSADSVYFSNGFKIGDVTPTTAVIWTRLCSEAKPIAVHHERKDKMFRVPIEFDTTDPIEE